MISYKYCLQTFMTAVSTVGAGILFSCFTSQEQTHWLAEAIGVLLVILPGLFMGLFSGTFEKVVLWCERMDQERQDERFINGKK